MFITLLNALLNGCQPIEDFEIALFVRFTVVKLSFIPRKGTVFLISKVAAPRGVAKVAGLKLNLEGISILIISIQNSVFIHLANHLSSTHTT